MFRFVASAATQYSFTVNDLMDLYFVATTATAGYRLASAIRIRGVEMWAGPYAAGAPYVTNTISFQWQTVGVNSIGGPSILFSDTTMGSNDAAHLKLTPPAGSLASTWLSAGATDTDTIFTLACNTGSIFDLHVEIHLPEGGAAGDVPVAVVRAVAGATAGTLYCSSLPVGGITLTPVAIATL